MCVQTCMWLGRGGSVCMQTCMRLGRVRVGGACGRCVWGVHVWGVWGVCVWGGGAQQGVEFIPERLILMMTMMMTVATATTMMMVTKGRFSITTGGRHTLPCYHLLSPATLVTTLSTL